MLGYGVGEGKGLFNSDVEKEMRKGKIRGTVKCSCGDRGRHGICICYRLRSPFGDAAQVLDPVEAPVCIRVGIEKRSFPHLDVWTTLQFSHTTYL